MRVQNLVHFSFVKDLVLVFEVTF